MRQFLPFLVASISVLGAQGPVGLTDEACEALLTQGEQLLLAGRFDEALPLIRKAAEAGYPMAMSQLGQCLWLGQGGPVDLQKAHEWCRRAADKGDRRGKTLLGYFYLEGIGVPKDERAALSWLQQGAELGHAKAQFLLARFHLDGRLVPRDPARAMELYGKAAEQGDAESLSMLGYGYATGTGLPRDEGRAEACWKQAAELGSRQAWRNLGTLLGSQNRLDERVPPAEPFELLEASEAQEEGGLGALTTWAAEKAGAAWTDLKPEVCHRPPFELLAVPLIRRPTAGKGAPTWDYPAGVRAQPIPVASVEQEYALIRAHGSPSGLPLFPVDQHLLGDPPRDLVVMVDGAGQRWSFEFAVESFYGKLDAPEAPAWPEEAQAIVKALEAGLWPEAADAKLRQALQAKAPSLAVRQEAELLSALLAPRPDPEALRRSARELRRLLPYNISAQCLAGIAFLLAGDEQEARRQRGWAATLVLSLR